MSPSIKWGQSFHIGGLKETTFEKLLAPSRHLVNFRDSGASLSFHATGLANLCQHLLPLGNWHGKWDESPIICNSRNELRNQTFDYSSVTYLQHLALEPQEPASFCLRVKNGLVWDEGCFCFILLYKQKPSLISLLKGWGGSWVRWGAVNVKLVTLPSLWARLTQSVYTDLHISHT